MIGIIIEVNDDLGIPLGYLAIYICCHSALIILMKMGLLFFFSTVLFFLRVRASDFQKIWTINRQFILRGLI